MAHTTPHTVTLTLPARLEPLVHTAALLERFEAGVAPADAAQYQALVQQALRLLAATPADADLDQLLGAFPVLATLYENLRYEHAGLCRQPLAASLNGELATQALIQRLRARPH